MLSEQTLSTTDIEDSWVLWEELFENLAIVVEVTIPFEELVLFARFEFREEAVPVLLRQELGWAAGQNVVHYDVEAKLSQL